MCVVLYNCYTVTREFYFNMLHFLHLHVAAHISKGFPDYINSLLNFFSLKYFFSHSLDDLLHQCLHGKYSDYGTKQDFSIILTVNIVLREILCKENHSLIKAFIYIHNSL